MERVCKYGRMEVNTKGTGNKTWQMEKDVSSTQMETFTKVSGLTTKLMEREHIFTWTEQSILANGEKTNSTGSEWRPGPTVLGMKVTMSMERNMVLEPSSGPITPCISVNFTTTTSTEKVFTPGQTAESMRGNGETIKCTGEALLLGLTAGNTSESTLMIRNMVMESSFGQMVVHIKEIGKEVNNTEKEYISRARAQRNTVSGKKARELGGLAVEKEEILQVQQEVHQELEPRPKTLEVLEQAMVEPETDNEKQFLL